MHPGATPAFVNPIRYFKFLSNEHPLPKNPLIPLPPANLALGPSSMLATQHVFQRGVWMRFQSSLGVLRSPGVRATCQSV